MREIINIFLLKRVLSEAELRNLLPANCFLSDFESLGKAFEKAKKVVEAEGIPRFYVRCLTELEDFVAEVKFFHNLFLHVLLSVQ